MAIRNLTNGVVYIEGTEAVGTCMSVELPDIEVDQNTQAPLGMIGEVNLPARFAAMEATVTWLHQPPEFANFMNNVKQTFELQIRADQATYSSEGLPQTGQYTCILRGRPTGINLSTFEQGEGSNPETVMTVDYVLVTVDGQNLLEVDVTNTAGYRVNGQLIRLTGA